MAGTVRLGKPTSMVPQHGAQSKVKSTDVGVSSFQVVEDTPKSELTIQGVDGSGNPIHIGDGATIAVSTANAAVCDVLKHRADSFKLTPTGPGTVNITVVVTFLKGGSPGPFTITIPVTVLGAKGSDLPVVLGTITIA